jgi:polysaccharide export outer membrane protein
MRSVSFAVALACLAGCASNPRPTPAADVAQFASAIQFTQATESDLTYRIGPSDKLALKVFQVPDLSYDEIFVDAAGNLQLPLVGSIRAAGLTTAELTDMIAVALRQRYLRDPQVTVTVIEAASQKITVDGAVTKPGVYKMQGDVSLLQAIAMAEGPTRIADLKSVAVFRTVRDRSMVAVFDLRAIRSGQAADPSVLGDDVIVVDTSQMSARMQDLLQALPALASFFYYAQN